MFPVLREINKAIYKPKLVKQKWIVYIETNKGRISVDALAPRPNISIKTKNVVVRIKHLFLTQSIVTALPYIQVYTIMSIYLLFKGDLLSLQFTTQNLAALLVPKLASYYPECRHTEASTTNQTPDFSYVTTPSDYL